MGTFNTLFGTKQGKAVLIRGNASEIDGTFRDAGCRFTDEEWALLLCLPVDACYTVAAADGGLDDEAALMFARLLDGASTLPNPLLSALMGDVASNGPAYLLKLVRVESQPRKAARLEQTRRILRDRLSLQEYRRFLGLVLVMAHQVAKAAGGSLSTAKRQALLAFAERYEIDPHAALACTCHAAPASSPAGAASWTAQ